MLTESEVKAATGNVIFIEFDNKKYIMPSHIQIEVVGGKGMCNARCSMCTIDKWQRPPTIMSNQNFEYIVESLKPFRQRIEYITLHGNGEPLIDKELYHKVSYAKKSGLNGIGFASNCSLLTPEISEKLIKSGLDTIICSVDGFKKETHEAIRPGTNFDEVVNNIKTFIKIRNKFGKTKVLVRFIRQATNYAEFDEYKKYWESILNPEYGDKVLVFNIHNWGTQLSVDNKINETFGTTYKSNLICKDLFSRMIIFPDGDLAFCDADYNGFYDLGNVLSGHFLKLYNSAKFTLHRSKMINGLIDELPFCKNCTIPVSRANK